MQAIIIIDMTDIRKINLNLLVALDALLTEVHVSRAAEKVGIGQSAMSAALKQCREIFDDPLLSRGGRGQMTLTPYAETLRAQVRKNLDDIAQTFSGKSAFSPTHSERTFHIGMSDFVAFVVLPDLLKRLRAQAPKVKIIQHALNHLSITREMDNLDLAIGNFPQAPTQLKAQQLFSDTGVIVGDKHHPIFKKPRLTLKSLCQYPQIFVSLEGQPEKNFIQDYLIDEGCDPKTLLITPHTMIPMQCLAGTDTLTHTVTRLAKPFLKTNGLAMKPAPYAHFPDYVARQYWHMKWDKDPAHQWLRQVIYSMFLD